MPRASLLIVDDEKNILSTLSRALRVEDFEVDVAGNATIGLEKLAKTAYDLVLLDVNLPDVDGIEVLRRLRAQKNDVPVIVMSGHGTIDTAVQATRLGAHDFLEKPIGTERLLLSIERLLAFYKLGEENKELKQRAGVFDALLGDSAPMQAKLLRVLQEGEIERVGGNDVLKVDVRVVAASNKALPAEVEAGRFRADLYDRLNVLPLRVPPLRERSEDVPLLAAHFLRAACAANDRRGKSLSDGAMRLLTHYDYPGNVRELRNLVERLVILTPHDDVVESDARALLPMAAGGAGAAGGGAYRPGTPLREMVEEAERDLVLRALEHHQSHITKTAADLGLERSHLYKKMRALGIKKASEDDADSDG